MVQTCFQLWSQMHVAAVRLNLMYFLHVDPIWTVDLGHFRLAKIFLWVDVVYLLGIFVMLL